MGNIDLSRIEFERWIGPKLKNGGHLNRSSVGGIYLDNRVAAKWSAWDAAWKLCLKVNYEADKAHREVGV